MEDNITSFFINGLKIHIDSSLNKYQDKENLIFDKDFENIFLNPLFINNINLFREIIEHNNLNYTSFWNHIGKIMSKSLQTLLNKFKKEIEVTNDNDHNAEVGNLNYLKLSMLDICFYLITNEDNDSFETVKEDYKDKLKNLLELYIKTEIKNNNDFSLFIKNYVIKITVLINNNGREINIGFLKYLLVLLFNLESVFNKNEYIKQLKIYINQVINNPRGSLNNYLNGAFNKKNYKKEKFSRSRGASFDIKDTSPNNNNLEKSNKKIIDYFKREPNKGKENLNTDNLNNEINNISKLNSNCTKENDINKNLLNDIKKESNKLIDFKNYKGNLNLISSNPSNLSLFKFDSGISNHSNFYLSENISFSKNNSKLGLDDSFDFSRIFSKPISELSDNKENKESNSNKIKMSFPCLIKEIKNKKRKPLERLKNKLLNQMNIKSYMSIENKNKNENIEKMKELRKMVNYNFYGNEKEREKENNKYEEKEKIKDLENNCDGNKEKNVLISKTPKKNENINRDKCNQENINLNQIKKNWGILFSQKINL